VRLEDRARIAEYAEKENQRFLSLPSGLNWSGLSGGAGIAIAAPPDWGKFVRHIKTRRSSPRLFVGTPVDMLVFSGDTPGEKVRLISPVFVQQVEYKVEAGMLYLMPVGPVVVNHGWLEKRFKKAEDRRIFSELVGLDRPERDDEDGHRSVALPGFREVVDSLFHSFRDWWKEHPDINTPNTTPGFHEISDRGLRNRAVLMAQPRLKYSGRLYEELLWLARKATDQDLDRSALRHLFPHQQPTDETAEVHPPDGEAERRTDVAECEPLNDQQQEACRLGLNAPIGVITGPPGTGKSRVVAHTMINAALTGQSALFSSRNHQAIEAVVPRSNCMVQPETLILRVSNPFGKGGTASLAQVLLDILARPHRSQLEAKVSAAAEHLTTVLEQRQHHQTTMRKAFECYDDLDQATERLASVTSCVPAQLVPTIETCPDLPGEADLTRLTAAVDCFRQPPAGWLKRLLWRLGRRLRGQQAVDKALRVENLYSAAFSTEPVADVGVRSESDLAGLLNALKSWQKVARGIAQAREVKRFRRELEMLPSLEECHRQSVVLQEQTVRSAKTALQLRAEAYGIGVSGPLRQRFAEIHKSIQAAGDNPDYYSDKLARAIRACFPELLRQVPLWATSNLTVGKNIPGIAGAFDLVIIDEASQCDIASVIPLLYRARRAMVVGDPMQLPHVSSISNETNRRLCSQFDLTDVRFGRFLYHVSSFFDLASTAEDLPATVRLEDHHRCHPVIAGYCNRTFYRKTLRVMTNVDALACPGGDATQHGGFRWTTVPSDVESARGGGCISRRQIDAVVAELNRLKGDRFPGTVGVVTPFRAQANRIRDKVEQAFGPEVPAHWRFHVDTADGFQGDERDLILLSIPGGFDMPKGSQWFLAQGGNRFNVAVSRARALLHVFADADWCGNCGIGHVEELHRACRGHAETLAEPFRSDLVGPVWEPKLATAMRNAGIDFRQQYPTCGRYLDFAVVRENVKLDIEVDGEAYHRSLDGTRKIDDLYRDLALIGNGWKVLRFWVYELREDMDACVERIEAALE